MRGVIGITKRNCRRVWNPLCLLVHRTTSEMAFSLRQISKTSPDRTLILRLLFRFGTTSVWNLVGFCQAMLTGWRTDWLTDWPAWLADRLTGWLTDPPRHLRRLFLHPHAKLAPWFRIFIWARVHHPTGRPDSTAADWRGSIAGTVAARIGSMHHLCLWRCDNT